VESQDILFVPAFFTMKMRAIIEVFNISKDSNNIRGTQSPTVDLHMDNTTVKSTMDSVGHLMDNLGDVVMDSREDLDKHSIHSMENLQMDNLDSIMELQGDNIKIKIRKMSLSLRHNEQSFVNSCKKLFQGIYLSNVI
jgi:hypothetical protein